jgi:hypothetical protein
LIRCSFLKELLASSRSGAEIDPKKCCYNLIGEARDSYIKVHLEVPPLSQRFGGDSSPHMGAEIDPKKCCYNLIGEASNCYRKILL